MKSLTILNDGISYVFTPTQIDGSTISALRRQLAQRFIRVEFEHGLTPKVADTCYENMLNIATKDGISNESKLQDILRFIFALQTRRRYSSNKDSLLWLGLMYFRLQVTEVETGNVLNDEPIFDTNGVFDRMKYDVIMKYGTEDDILFFCEMALKYTPELEITSSADLRTYLKEVEEILNLSPMPM